jgi:hypothetical protein
MISYNPALFSRDIAGYKDNKYLAGNVNLFAAYKTNFGLSAKGTVSYNIPTINLKASNIPMMYIGTKIMPISVLVEVMLAGVTIPRGRLFLALHSSRSIITSRSAIILSREC